MITCPPSAIFVSGQIHISSLFFFTHSFALIPWTSCSPAFIHYQPIAQSPQPCQPNPLLLLLHLLLLTHTLLAHSCMRSTFRSHRRRSTVISSGSVSSPRHVQRLFRPCCSVIGCIPRSPCRTHSGNSSSSHDKKRGSINLILKCALTLTRLSYSFLPLVNTGATYRIKFIVFQGSSHLWSSVSQSPVCDKVFFFSQPRFRSWVHSPAFFVFVVVGSSALPPHI
jgi:hypothetical protein